MRKHIVPEGPEEKDQVHIETEVHMSDLIRSIEVRDFLGVGSLVGELRPHRPHGKQEKEKKKKSNMKQKPYCNKFNKD